MRKNKKLPVLTVHRETLAVLADQKLMQVVGGSQSVVGRPCQQSALAACAF